jgi:hypothetical protein
MHRIRVLQKSIEKPVLRPGFSQNNFTEVMKLLLTYGSYVPIDRCSINYRRGAAERSFNVLEGCQGTKYQWP